MKKLQMQKFVGAVLFTSLCAGLVLAQPLEAPSNDPAAVDAVKQVGQEMGKAMMASDHAGLCERKILCFGPQVPKGRR